MSTYFVSDLHLSSQEPFLRDRFLRFLKKEASNADALYILGDLFEVWIGDDAINEAQQTIIQALHDLHQNGLPIYVMVGNRDFLIGEQFAKASGCTLIPDPTRLLLYGHPVLIMHGDTLCLHDKKYQWFRRLVRAPLAQLLFKSLPIWLRKAIANRIRRHSDRSHQTTTSLDRSYQDVALDAVYQQLRQYQCDTLIHGHTHKPNAHCFLLDGKTHTRFVLSDWHATPPTLLVYSLDGPSLKTLEE